MMIPGPNGLGWSHSSFPSDVATYAYPSDTLLVNGDNPPDRPVNAMGRFSVAPRYFACYVLWDTSLTLDSDGNPISETSDYSSLFRWQRIKPIAGLPPFPPPPSPSDPNALDLGKIKRTQYGRHIPFLDGVIYDHARDSRKPGEPDFILRRGKVKPLNSSRIAMPASTPGGLNPNWFYPEYEYTFWKATNSGLPETSAEGVISDWYLYYGPNNPPNEPSQESSAEGDIVLGPINDPPDTDTDAHWSLALVETKIGLTGPSSYPSFINYKLCPRITPFPDMYPGNWFRTIDDSGSDPDNPVSTNMSDLMDEYADAGPPPSDPDNHSPHWNDNSTGRFSPLWRPGTSPQKFLCQPKPFHILSRSTTTTPSLLQYGDAFRLGFANMADWNQYNLYVPVYSSLLAPWGQHAILVTPYYP